MIVVLAAALAVTSCSSKGSNEYLKSTDRTAGKHLASAHAAVYRAVADTIFDGKKTLGEWDMFPLKTNKGTAVSGREACGQIRKEAPAADKTAPFLLACSKDDQHAVIVGAKNGKPTWTAGPEFVMFYDGTMFLDGDTLVVSMTDTGASARISSDRWSLAQLKALDDSLIGRWQEGFWKYFHSPLSL